MNKFHTISFKHAWEGVAHAFTTQPNFRVHVCLALVAIFLSVVLKIYPVEWIIILLLITLGLVFEMLNTAIESVVDLATSEWHILAKHAKDVAAGAMLVYSIGAVCIAAVIFLPKLIN